MPVYTDPNPNPAAPEPEMSGNDQSKSTSSQDSGSQDQPQPDSPTQTGAQNQSGSAADPTTTSDSTSGPASDKTTQDQPQGQNNATPPNQAAADSSVIINEEKTDSDDSGSGSSAKKFVLPILGVLLLVLGVGTGVFLVRQNQNIEEEASENCLPPTAGQREWWSVEIGNDGDLPPTDSGQIVGLEPGTTEVVVEAWSDSAFGCGTNQSDESTEVQVNDQTVIVTDEDVPGSTTVQVEIGQDGVLNISARALGSPGSMFVFVRVPSPAPVACEIPPAEGRIILNFTDDQSFLDSLEQAQSLDFNTEGQSYRVLIQLINEQGNKEFFVVLIDNEQDSVFITRTGSIDSLPTTLSEYEELSDDNITLGPDMASLESMIGAHTGQDPESISVICASFEEYDLDAEPTPTEQPTGVGVSCSQVMVYDTEWNQIPNSDLSTLNQGDVVRFAVTGSATSGTIDLARFKINSGDWIESGLSVPGEENSFYTEYTIPADTQSFNIDGQVHHLENDSWY